MERTCFRLRISSVSANRRLLYSEEVIESMCVTVRSHGAYDPIEVWFDGERFRILDGEKRYRACKRLHMTHIDAVIVEKHSAR